MGTKRNIAEVVQDPVPSKRQRTSGIGGVSRRKRGVSESSGSSYCQVVPSSSDDSSVRPLVDDGGSYGVVPTGDLARMRGLNAILDPDDARKLMASGSRVGTTTNADAMAEKRRIQEENMRLDPLFCIANKLKLKMGVHSVARVKRLVGKVAAKFAQMKVHGVGGSDQVEGGRVKVPFSAIGENAVSSTSDGLQL